MLYSPSHQFLFIHIGKTAGTSIQSVLEPYCNHPDTSTLNRLRSKLGLQRNHLKCYFGIHARYQDVEKIFPQQVLENTFKFAFVRNPWDRLVSYYFYFRKDANHRLHHQVMAMDFASFVRFEAQQAGKRAQLPGLLSATGEIGLDRIGRFENLATDFNSILDEIGLSHHALPTSNQTSHEHYSSYYTDETRDLVASHWKDEIDTFGYKFEQD